MIVKGEFDDYRRPFVKGLLFIPKFHARRRIDFLVDTGSDTTTLNPSDGKWMDVDYSRLRFNADACGFGGNTKVAPLSASVTFATDEGMLAVYRIQLDISSLDTPEILPSVLGTDVLFRWQICWNSPKDLLDFTVLSVDETLEGELAT